MSYYNEPDGQLTLLELGGPEDAAAQPRRKAPAKSVSELVAIPYLYLDLSPGHVDLFGNHYWELRSPYREGKPPLNTGPSPREPIHASLSDILEADPDKKYDLSQTACRGILRRAEERGKELPPQLKAALLAQAGISSPSQKFHELKAYHINQRDEGIDLGGVSEALMATSNMQMQTFIVEDCLTPWDTQQARIFAPEGTAPTLAGADGGGGRNPAGLLFAAGFCAGAAPTAKGIGYQEEVSPTLKAAESGTNMVPSVLCLNDQGGSVMDCSEDVAGTLRAQEHGHQPLVLAIQQGGAELGAGVCPTITVAADSGNHQPVLFENHGIDARYTGPHPVAPTLSARAGTGGNNLPLIGQELQEAICIMGPAIDRQPHNGGNGIGCQEKIAYTLTATDHHAVFSRQRVDLFTDGEVASTQSARQYKDATDLVLQTSLERPPRLIRRLTPLECERLQGFPDGWTALPGASDSARYRALGNSVAIPCVEFVLMGIVRAAVLAG